MELKLVAGRPECTDGRLEKELRCYDFLDGLGVAYERIDHEVTSDMQACERIDQILGATTCKNLFLTNRQQTQFYLLLIPGNKPFKTKDISKQIGSARLSFAGAEAMEAHLDITPGSVSILGLMNDKEHKVELLVDEEVLKEELFGCHPCINTVTLRLKTTDVFGPVLAALQHPMRTVSLPWPEDAP